MTTGISADLSSPDWASQTEEVHCPLCEYNLRGLVEPRCPECGYAFNWQELLDTKRRQHPYLFEHHPKRNIWSLWRTFYEGLDANSFWRTLTAAQSIHRGRLLAYWFITSALFMPMLTCSWSSTPGPTVYSPLAVRLSRVSGAYRMVVNGRTTLTFNSMSFSSTVSRNISGVNPLVLEGLLRMAILFWLWPWLTLMVLMIFRSSMSRSKIKFAHTLRAVLYSTDVGVTAAVVCVSLNAVFFVSQSLRSATTLPGTFRSPLLEINTDYAVYSLIFIGMGFRFTRKLSAAYRHYLRFNHAGWVVLSSQLILWLAAICLYLNWDRF